MVKDQLGTDYTAELWQKRWILIS